ncbi:MAG: vitamin B12-dependent ribonucleotide reductase [Desulfovibrionaceae bacterium]|nr:vitamin B12-dependent ribonucleotide reductase [Desulfovibrionaceae bacterium]
MLNSVELNPNAAVVLAKRYYLKGPDGSPVEDAKGLFWRVSLSMAAEENRYPGSRFKAEALAEEFYRLMTSWKFLPNSPTLMNAGTGLGQLSACFVLPVGDSIEEIFDAVKHAAMIHKSGGGTGFSFSRLRARDSRVGSTGGVASGPLSFLRIFNTATEQIKQGGTRRGANMGILRVDHPDIMHFIQAKEKDGEYNNFNLSVALTERFMESVDQGGDYPLINPLSFGESGRANAREVFELLVLKAWQSGEPGIIFIDRINRDNPTPEQGDIESTNPCGEQPLLPFEACNLGSVNLTKFYQPPQNSGHGSIDWTGLKDCIHLAIRFLDNVVGASVFPLPQITERVLANRKVGLGVMGWADLLFMLRIPYNSEEGIELAQKLMSFIREESREASRALAEERGPFPAYECSALKAMGFPPLRNATLTTIAPTGTLSILAGCSSGIEPLFALSFDRMVMDGENLKEINPVFAEVLQNDPAFTPELLERIVMAGSIVSFEELPVEMRRIFVTAMDIEPEWHLRMQAAFQQYTDNAVSKTVNLPASASVEDVRRIYHLAYDLGCKGVTVYRDGSRSSQVLTAGTAKDPLLDVMPELPHSAAVLSRPGRLTGITQKVNTGHGTMYVTVNELDGKPFEVFATIGKSGYSIMAKAEAIGRLISLCLRGGTPIKDIARQIRGIGGDSPVFQQGKKGNIQSIPDGIAWVLEDMYPECRVENEQGESLHNVCPECGQNSLRFQEGCLICMGCAFSRCS